MWVCACACVPSDSIPCMPCTPPNPPPPPQPPQTYVAEARAQQVEVAEKLALVDAKITQVEAMRG